MAEGVLIGMVIGFGAGVLVTVAVGMMMVLSGRPDQEKTMDIFVWFILLGGAYIFGMLSGVFTSCLMIASGRYHEEEEKFIGRTADEEQGKESSEDDQRWSGGREPEQ